MEFKEEMLDIFKVPPKIMKIVIRAAMIFKALLIRAKAQKNRHTRLRLQTEVDPHYENGRLLQLKGKLIKPVPRDLYTLTELTTLDMSASRESNLDCLLDKLPVELIFLKNLRCLHIDVNNISIIPVEIGELVNLEKLTFTNNKISCLPSSFKKLQNLRSLHLANNQFEHFPIIVCSLLNLEFLDFSNNQLEAIPDQISDLKYMQIFLLFHNILSSIPESLCTLTKLKTLWLGDNRIRKLPHSIVNMKSLDWETSQLSSNVGGNPLVDPPVEICEKGVKAIVSYYRSMGRRKSSQRRLSIDSKRSSVTSITKLPRLDETTTAPRRPSLRNFNFKNDFKLKPIIKNTSTVPSISNRISSSSSRNNDKNLMSSVPRLPKIKFKS